MPIPVKISANPPNTLQGVVTSSKGASPKNHGPFTVGVNLYLVLSLNNGGGDFTIEIYKSIDNGVTWTVKDAINAPHFLGSYSTVLNGAIIELVFCSLLSVPVRRTAYQEFNTTTDTYGVADEAPNPADPDLRDGNGDLHATKLASGDYLVVYNGGVRIVSQRRVAGIWQDPPISQVLQAGGTTIEILGITSDSSNTGYFSYIITTAGGATPSQLTVRSLTSAGALSGEFVVSTSNAGSSTFQSVNGFISILNSKLIIPSVYQQNSGVEAPIGSPGIWEGTPLAAPVWVFKAAGSITPSVVGVSFLVISATAGVVFWMTHTGGNQIWGANYDGTIFGTPVLCYDWGVDPPAGGGGVSAVANLMKQLTVRVVGSNYGIALAIVYNTPANDYSTFYLLATALLAPEGGNVNFRLQIFDDGAGEYLFDAPTNHLICGGSGNTVTGLSGNARGPFILPSPIPVCKPGLLTVAISNVNAPTNGGAAENDANTILAYVGLVFAIPKKCRDVCYGGREGVEDRIERGLERRGVL